MSNRRRAIRDPEWDVIVVGAGPAGSTCAEQLARRGHSVVLLERDHAPGVCANCTGVIGEEAFEVFDLPRAVGRQHDQERDFSRALSARGQVRGRPELGARRAALRARCGPRRAGRRGGGRSAHGGAGGGRLA